MILRSVMKHVRDQNWVAVGLDFVIVVVGVFIGIQVANWNEERQLREREAYVIEQLALDMRMIERQAQQTRDVYLESAAASDRVMAFVSSDLEAPEDDARFSEDLQNVITGRPPVGRPPAIVELLSSGNTEIIGDDDLREAVIRFDVWLQGALSVQSTNADLRRPYLQDLVNKVILSDSIDDDLTQVQTSVSDYDLLAMRTDPTFLSSISMLKRLHVINHYLAEQTVRRSGNLAERLENFNP